LGNFISAQVNEYKDYGVIFKVTVKKHFPSGVTEIAEVETIPTYVHRYAHNGRKNYRVLPLEEVLKERSDPLLSEQDYAVFAGKLEEMDRHLQSLLVPADTLPSR
jgi:poly-gamma-glutamate synthesis protein (capsule biosynthesis protein)